MTGGELLRFTVLGRLRAWQGDNEVQLGSRQQRTLLALLLLRQGEPVTTDALVDAMWGQDPPARAVGTLRTYVSRLRKVLEPEPGGGAAPSILVSVWDGYAIRLPREAVDLGDFDSYVAGAERARAAGRLAEARDMLRAGLALWGDEPLPGLSGPGIQAQRDLLTERRLMALEARFDLDLRLGEHAAVIGELTALAARHPLREQLCGLLMLALHRSGRTAEALAAHEHTRRTLADECGLEPGPELTALLRRITAEQARPAAPEPERAPGTARGPSSPAPAQLPGDIADFTGRGREVAELCALLDAPEGSAATVVAVSGIGGVGKSALAVHAAHQVRTHFPQGQLYADLRGPDGQPVDPATALGSFLRALGVPDTDVPEGLAERAGLFRTRIADRRLLILLDNARDAGQIRPFLPGTASCAVLVTSATKLAGLPAARLLHLDVMCPEEAGALLRRVVGEERADAEPEATARLASTCGWLPLALRIAAARLVTRPSWTLSYLAERLSDQERRQAELRVADLAVETAFQREYGRLDDQQKRTFRLLSLADAPDITSAVAAVALDRPQEDVEALCESLVDASLLESPAPGRYRFHDLLRSFARGCARAEEKSVTRAEVRRRLVRSYVPPCGRFLQAVIPSRTALRESAAAGPALRRVVAVSGCSA
ncbi:BTAD domain-containing putative transcriptional regulator [Streptomyces sp. MST-110588]|uniref:AfsR/SARP family transcriptional regulator n=1 Tax=Streptomyces sp. MST-110588 TaxID=2833628 RepID=UPI001F5C8EF2|nr:BTAD domain-containing putative transcriptional regulator [Streptomyces sp. MST-110588]UNO38550.1 winged helix-turn-helix domain-containing protein [Streptomyces sp. MST-110588]